MLEFVKVLATYDGGGCGWYRVQLPMEQMARHGHAVEMACQKDGKVSSYLSRSSEYNIILGQRFIDYRGISVWRRARRPGNRLVYENDDDIFNIDLINRTAYNTYGQADVREAVKCYCEASDLLTVTTPYLAKAFTDTVGDNAPVTVLPNFIPEFVLKLPREQYARPRVGWVGGGSHNIDITECTRAVRRFLTRSPGWDLYLGGQDYRPSFDLKNLDQMIFRPWVQVNEAPEEFYGSYQFDIGLAPLLDTRFARSKSYVKALEMNARGIPVIASDIEPYREYIRHGYNGFLVRREHEWLKYLHLLADNPGTRAEMSANARATAGEYTIEGNWKLWEQAYEAML